MAVDHDGLLLLLSPCYREASNARRPSRLTAEFCPISASWWQVKRWTGHNLTTALSLERKIACEQTLREALAVGQEKEEELVTTSLEFEFHLQFPYDSPPTLLSGLRQSLRNELEC